MIKNLSTKAGYYTDSITAAWKFAIDLTAELKILYLKVVFYVRYWTSKYLTGGKFCFVSELQKLQIENFTSNEKLFP